MTKEEAKKKICEIVDEISLDESKDFRSLNASKADSEETTDQSIEEFEKSHPVGGCLVPDNIDELPKLSLGSTKFVSPAELDLRGYCTWILDQGQNPICAGAGMAQMVSNIYFRKNNYPEKFDAMKIYKEAKRIEGNNDDGTTLTAVMQAALNFKYFDAEKCKIRTIYHTRNAIELVKYAIHKFGIMLLGLNITSEWYAANKKKTSITGNGNYRVCGGHCVCATGFIGDETKDMDNGGIIITNSWGPSWACKGSALITYREFEKEFMYGCALSNTLDGFDVVR